MQRLHGMGEGVYREVMKNPAMALPVRVYAPVGEHRDLLAYLVRRLLENGANSSFVHQLADPKVDVSAELLARVAAGARRTHARLTAPAGGAVRHAGTGNSRANSTGADLQLPRAA